ncbi:MAG: pyridoxamine 5'-phosphate oxidase [Terrimicrobiaceae bacterium]|nr:pyridoxamine 5'-phosphate oxidase [Terrimicrobiaceae bacterium]
MITEAMRRDYAAGELRRADLESDPLAQFERWFGDALAEQSVIEANAMTLATVDAAGQPHARIVLLKDCDARGFRFFTNYESGKGVEIAANPRVALLFHWAPLERQVRIEGVAEKTPRAESEAYFESRPIASRLSAWASAQSREIASREELEGRYAALAKTYADGRVPTPPNWGGYVVRPAAIEFWQGRRSRLHDRFRYTRQADASWLIERLAP